jgi:hypothetical protein
MKTTTPLIFLLFFVSCNVTEYYQVYETSTDHGTLSRDKIIFDDENCSVTYNLWAEGGNIGFSIYNKTENDLTIDLTKTYFVLNGTSYEYFQSRTFTKSANLGTTVASLNYPNYYYGNRNVSKISGTVSSGISTTYTEKPELTIPPKTLQTITEYRIANVRYANCDLPRYPSSNKIKTLSFDKSNSPFVFYNIITYKIKGESIRIENKFFVSAVTNYPSKEMFTSVDTSVCGQKLTVPKRVFKNIPPDRFYVRYSKEK